MFRECKFANRAGFLKSRETLEMTRDVTHLGKVDFRRDERIFGIKREDRFAHIYVIGKTGTGKSTLLEGMASQDLADGNGVALIDPLGDLAERVAALVAASQRDDLIYRNAADVQQPWGYNPCDASRRTT
jgi:ATPase subunit of ABC transporter with duplicated ATPase domains